MVRIKLLQILGALQTFAVYVGAGEMQVVEYLKRYFCGNFYRINSVSQED